MTSFAVFLLIRAIPGTVVDAMIAQYMGMSEENMDIESARIEIETSLGLHRPLLQQYFIWIWNIIIEGDLGKSLWRDTLVSDEIAMRWPVTLQLGFMSMIISIIISLPIGIYSAVRQDSFVDNLFRSFAILCVVVPSFWLGTIVIVFPSIWWGYSPPLVYSTFTDDPLNNLKMFLFPSLVLGMSLAGGTMRLTRTMMLEVLKQDYVRTAFSKGLKEKIVIMRHAFRNSLIPVVTSIGPELFLMIGGSVIIEQIFSLPGIGRLTLQAIQTRDYPVISGVLLIFSVALIFINLMIDLSYAYLDPRIRYKLR
tara:strand:+ start:819 stop:1745 length:927 start_codon:yes stop_codon:yes gene_type:complete